MSKSNYKFKVGWKVANLSYDIASIRYRALLPAIALNDSNIESQIFSDANFDLIEELDLLVVVKSFTVDDLLLVQRANDCDVPVILDLCDNIFIDSYGVKPNKKSLCSIAHVFSVMAHYSSLIVVPTETLAKVVSSNLEAIVPVTTIPDGLETQELRKLMRQKIKCLKKNSKVVKKKRLKPSASIVNPGTWSAQIKFATLFLKRTVGGLRNKEIRKAYANKIRCAYLDIKSKLIRKKPKTTSKKVVPVKGDGKKRILWFGNHGAPYADFGILDLLPLRDSFEKLAKELSVELMVVSNNSGKYKKFIKPFSIDSKYCEWDIDTIDEHIAQSDVVIVPNSLDDFSICKSNNRTILALSNNIPVVATSTASLIPLKDCILFDDFYTGIKSYLTDKSLSQEHVGRGNQLVDKLYGQKEIGGQWRDVIMSVLRTSEFSNNPVSPEVIFAIQLPQDIEIARTLWKDAIQRGIDCEVWICASSILRWPQLFDSIKDSSLPYKILSDSLVNVDVGIFKPTVRTLISVTESNLRPHRFTYKLAKLANTANILTVTMQHGLENIGLTYSDNEHDIKNIHFMSKKIYTWGYLETLHKNIPLRTRRKCIPVGCPKPQMTSIKLPESLASLIFSTNQPEIGIFENLHWHRYSDEYREFFINSIRKVIADFPNVNFVIKPHNAGIWLTERYKGEIPEAENLRVIDPKLPQWANVTAAQLFDHIDAVITTPSTVALDAARANLPVAIVSKDIELQLYKPLPLLSSYEDWLNFVDKVLEEESVNIIKDLSRNFVEKAMIPGNATSRIVDDLMSQDALRISNG